MNEKQHYSLDREPPAYDSLFGRLKQVKEESSNPFTFTKNVFGILTGSSNFFPSCNLSQTLILKFLYFLIIKKTQC